MQSNFDPEKHTRFIPTNKEKYRGSKPPVARSSWEESFMTWCDRNPYILEWGSEMFSISYFDPIKQRNRKYFPDFIIKVKDRDEKEKVFLIEIKPKKETKEPSMRGKKTRKTLLYEQRTYITNQAKWKAAYNFCQRKGIIFKIITEDELFGIKNKH